MLLTFLLCRVFVCANDRKDSRQVGGRQRKGTCECREKLRQRLKFRVSLVYKKAQEIESPYCEIYKCLQRIIDEDQIYPL